ncbi:MAG: chloride channel protein [Bacteroidia bacterium]
MKLKPLLQKISINRFQLSHRNFFLLLSMVVGIVAGLAAVALKEATHSFESLLEIHRKGINYWLLIFPVIGIMLATLYTQLIQKGKLGRGISNVVNNIYHKSSYMEKDKMYSHMITSSVTVGFGGSMGLEAPIVVTGAAFGSNIAALFNLDYKERTLLLACGAAAGISAIFGAPIAGVLFAIEVLLGEFSTVNFVPLLISSAVASVISQLLHNSEQVFYISSIKWDLKALPFYIALSMVTGFYSVYVMKGIAFSEKILKPALNPYKKALIGGVALGLMIFLFPPLYGEGYHTVQTLLNMDYSTLFDGSIASSLHLSGTEYDIALLVFTLGILLIKIVATQLTISSGGNGGFFAPSLFMGSVVGFFFVYSINHFGLCRIMGIDKLNEPNFEAVAMAGLMSGVMHTPLTAIFLIAEVTGGYTLLVPLMIVASFSFLISKYFMPHSIYVKH